MFGRFAPVMLGLGIGFLAVSASAQDTDPSGSGNRNPRAATECCDRSDAGCCFPAGQSKLGYRFFNRFQINGRFETSGS